MKDNAEGTPAEGAAAHASEKVKLMLMASGSYIHCKIELLLLKCT